MSKERRSLGDGGIGAVLANECGFVIVLKYEMLVFFGLLIEIV